MQWLINPLNLQMKQTDVGRRYYNTKLDTDRKVDGLQMSKQCFKKMTYDDSDFGIYRLNRLRNKFGIM